MTHRARIKIAAVAVVLFIAALSAAGLLSHTRAPGVGVTGQVPSAIHATPAPVQIHSLNFENDNHD